MNAPVDACDEPLEQLGVAASYCYKFSLREAQADAQKFGDGFTAGLNLGVRAGNNHRPYLPAAHPRLELHLSPQQMKFNKWDQNKTKTRPKQDQNKTKTNEIEHNGQCAPLSIPCRCRAARKPIPYVDVLCPHQQLVTHPPRCS